MADGWPACIDEASALSFLTEAISAPLVASLHCLLLSGAVSPSQMYIACLGTYYILVLLQVESCFICIFCFQGGEGVQDQ